MAKQKNTKQKSKNTKRKENEKKIENVGEFNGDFSHIVRVAGIIIIFFCLFYFLTVFLTDQGESNDSVEEEESVISYSEVLAGRSFSMPEEEYLVLYYDFDDEELSTLSSTISTYQAKDDALTLYSSNLGDGLNQKYVGESSNKQPSDISQLMINGPTLIHFKDKKVIDYIEGIDSINQFLA